jgi:hypothetical protein
LEHTALVESQYVWYLHILETLQPNQCLIVQDYTTIHEDMNHKTRVLNLTAITVKPHGVDFMKVAHHYDFIGYLKQDSQHTQSVWEFFLKE